MNETDEGYGAWYALGALCVVLMVVIALGIMWGS